MQWRRERQVWHALQDLRFPHAALRFLIAPWRSLAAVLANSALLPERCLQATSRSSHCLAGSSAADSLRHGPGQALTYSGQDGWSGGHVPSPYLRALPQRAVSHSPLQQRHAAASAAVGEPSCCGVDGRMRWRCGFVLQTGWTLCGSFAGAAQRDQAPASRRLSHAAGDCRKGSCRAERGTTGRGNPAQPAGFATQGGSALSVDTDASISVQ